MLIALMTALLTAVAAIIAALIQKPAPEPPIPVPINVEFVVDASQQMETLFVPGVTKWEAAKEVVTHKLAEIPSQARMALRRFGGKCFDDTNTQLVVPLASYNHENIRTVLKRIQPFQTGRSPLYEAVVQATGDFSDPRLFGGNTSINLIVITGSGDWCYENPADKIRSQVLMWQAAGRNIKIEYSYIGMGLSAKQEQQLREVAAQTGGTTYFPTNLLQLYLALGIRSDEAQQRWPDFAIDVNPKVLELEGTPSSPHHIEVEILVENEGGVAAQPAKLQAIFDGGKPVVLGRIPQLQAGTAWQVVKRLTYSNTFREVRFLIADHQGPDFNPENNQIIQTVRWIAPKPSSVPVSPPNPSPSIAQVPLERQSVKPALHQDIWNVIKKMEWIYIPAGSFIMGSQDSGHLADDNEKPPHQVTISQPFYMGKYEVTQAHWQAVMGNNPSKFKNNDHQVENVSWEDIRKFISKINHQAGYEACRLPTEAEWEYAARANTITAYPFGEDASNLGDYAWYDNNAGARTHPVGQKLDNGWGLYDMHGNVWEWVQDWYAPYTAESVMDPIGPDTGTYRVFRGGGWYDPARDVRSAFRDHSHPNFRDSYLGFRCSQTIPGR